MKKFIKLIIIFSVPILFLLIIIEFSLRDIPNDYKYKKEYLNNNSNELEVLFLGNSHVYFGINPVYINKKSFNASHISQSLDYDLAILKKYEGELKNLKYVIVPIDYFSFYSNLEYGIENWRIKNYVIYYDMPQKNSFWDNFEILNGKFENNLLRLTSNQSNITCNTLGWGTIYNSKNNKNLDDTGLISSKRHTVIKDNSIYDKNIQVVNSFIDFANRKNIKLIFITSPAYKTYSENLNKEQLETSINTINKLISGKTNSKYYNLLNDNSFKKGDFYDADHLNEIGAKKLSIKIDSLLRLN